MKNNSLCWYKDYLEQISAAPARYLTHQINILGWGHCEAMKLCGPLLVYIIINTTQFSAISQYNTKWRHNIEIFYFDKVYEVTRIFYYLHSVMHLYLDIWTWHRWSMHGWDFSLVLETNHRRGFHNHGESHY